MFIHCEMINVVYWVFLDIIEDLILCADSHNYVMDQFYYKDCLYRLIKLDKSGFLALMSEFNYPKIENENATAFLIGIDELIKKNFAKLFLADDNSDDASKLLHLGLLIFECLAAINTNLEFTLVYDDKISILQSDFSFFYLSGLLYVVKFF